MDNIFLLLVLFQIKHFLCDYPLQITYMLEKMKEKGWVIPLALHSLVHAIGTLLIVIAVNENLWFLAIADFAIHFTVDRIKASPRMLNRFSIDNKFFWWSLGADQMMHHLTHYAIIFIILKG